MPATIPTLLTALSLLTAVNAAPTDPQIALARQFAPQWRFHKDEVYFPSSIPFFLSNMKMVNPAGASVGPSSLAANNLDQEDGSGSGFFLTTDINANKGAGGFLRGKNPSTSSDPTVTTFIVPKDEGVVDLYYWLFTPFNEGKNVPLIGESGDHVGDWERLAVRTVNGQPTAVDYHAHDDKGSGTLSWASATKFDSNTRPAAYVAQGSHGFWSTAGTHTYVNAVVFKLNDDTSDGGVAWDTKDSIVPVLYPDTYSGDLEWLNYQGAWGNKGQTNCWWHFIVPDCAIVDGPTGPLRSDVFSANVTATSALVKSSKIKVDMTKAPLSLASKMTSHFSQILATASTASKSKYTIRIDSTVRAAAQKLNATHLAVKQVCHDVSGKEEGDDLDDVEESTTMATVKLTKATKFTITPAACASGTVSYYSLGVCTSTTQCQGWSAASRNIRAYSADDSVKSIQKAAAVTVDDLDKWEWV